MPKGLGRALAGGILGGIAGYGQGLAESGAAKREAALEQIKQFGMETLRSRNRREELGVASRLTEERETRKASRGLVDTKNLIQGDDGQLYMIRKNPGLIRRLVRATLKGLKDLMADPAAAAKDYVKAVPRWAKREKAMESTFRLYQSMTATR